MFFTISEEAACQADASQIGTVNAYTAPLDLVTPKKIEKGKGKHGEPLDGLETNDDMHSQDKAKRIAKPGKGLKVHGKPFPSQHTGSLNRDDNMASFRTKNTTNQSENVLDGSYRTKESETLMAAVNRQLTFDLLTG